ncbi:hypothetical protein THASP1DRAFT_21871 [Thamnocephalis sphaerospora]|uniref:Mso1 N-terminal domain-containing protein n=1 Tax=Thamnocephalis sphaerospora TaxID=78915 RepID=A0A4V1IXB0_9FUNG|nr:hypothetical protein THASP1DRAFT_21871 [Thamnocephalis sphaerospora]|eukprot:RKP10429.1 hypothetical protein THASP1DRAFT_21871 [Thamnocephalis sphaerospora]
MSTTDYRVSKLAVLCKDCGQDVGLYPGRHRCGARDAPPVPSVPISARSTGSPSLAPPPSSADAPSLAPPRPGLVSRSGASSGSNSSGRYGARAAPSSSGGSSLRTGAGRWARVADNSARDDKSTLRSNRGSGGDDAGSGSESGGNTIWDGDAANADQGAEEDGQAPSSSGGKLWGKIKAAASLEKSDEPDSDASDYEGETHVTRLLKAYYHERYPDSQLPGWLTQPPPEQPMPFRHLAPEAAPVLVPQAPASAPAFRRTSSDYGHNSGGGGPSADVGSYEPAYTGLETPPPAVGGGDGYAGGSYRRAGNGVVAPPVRRPTRPRGNVRRDAGAFFDE